jgi:hypothetical protein
MAEFLAAYFKAIDLLAVAALVALAIASFVREGHPWLMVAGLCAAAWAASRILGWP